MPLTLDLSADLLAEAASRGTSADAVAAIVLREHLALPCNPDPTREKVFAERVAHFAADAHAYQEWWDSLTAEEQLSHADKWERGSRAADTGGHNPPEVVFARIHAKYRWLQPNATREQK